MNSNIMKSGLVLGACAAMSFVTPPIMAATESDLPVLPQQQPEQTRKVTGVVSDAAGPIVGATVRENGTTNATITDNSGRFTLNVKPGAQLLVTYIGYKSTTVNIGTRTHLNISIEEDN